MEKRDVKRMEGRKEGAKVRNISKGKKKQRKKT